MYSTKLHGFCRVGGCSATTRCTRFAYAIHVVTTWYMIAKGCCTSTSWFVPSVLCSETVWCNVPYGVDSFTPASRDRAMDDRLHASGKGSAFDSFKIALKALCDT